MELTEASRTILASTITAPAERLAEKIKNHSSPPNDPWSSKAVETIDESKPAHPRVARQYLTFLFTRDTEDMS